MFNRSTPHFLLTTLLLGAAVFAQSPLSFDANRGDRIEIPSDPDLMNASAMTVECWVKPADSTGGRFITKGDGGSSLTDRSYEMGYANGRFQFFTYVGNVGTSGLVWNQTDPIFAPNRWYHVAGTFSSAAGESRIYVDGVLQSTVDQIASGPFVGMSLRQSTEDVQLGWNPPHLGSQFAGLIDNVRIWSIARSQSQIRGVMGLQISGDVTTQASYFLNGDAQDATTNGHHGTVIQGSFSTEGYHSGEFALFFDGDTDGATVQSAPELMNAQALTLEAWVLPLSNGTQRILVKGDGGSAFSSRSYTLSFTGSRFQFVAFLDGPLGSNAMWVTSAPNFAPGQWYHVAATYSAQNGEGRIYVDGQLEAVHHTYGGMPAIGATIRQSSQDISIGRSLIGTNVSLDGQIDDLRIWSTARSASQIASGMREITGTELGLEASYRFHNNFADSVGTHNATNQGASFVPVYRDELFEVVITPFGMGGFTIGLEGIPAGTVEGYTLISLNTSLPVGFGTIFGLHADAATFALLQLSPQASPGNPVHWTYPASAPLYPASAFPIPSGALPVGTEMDILAIAFDAALQIETAPVVRATLN